jgi:acetylglutamate kinase
VTDEKTMDVVEMVLCGQLNKEVASMITKQGADALGFSGKDGDVILAQRKLQKIANNDGSVSVRCMSSDYCLYLLA